MKQEEIRERQDKILNLVKAWAVIPHPYESRDAEGLLYSLSLEGVVIVSHPDGDLTGCVIVKVESLIREE